MKGGAHMVSKLDGDKSVDNGTDHRKREKKGGNVSVGKKQQKEVGEVVVSGHQQQEGNRREGAWGE